MLASFKVPFRRLLRFSRPDILLFVPAFIGCAFKGASQPLMAYLLARAMGDFYLSDESELFSRVAKTCYFFLGLAGLSFIAIIMQMGLFAKIGRGFAFRARTATFAALIKQDISFFDIPTNSAAVLGDLLFTKCEKMSAIAGESMGVFIEMLCAVAVGFTIGFIGSPALAGVILAMMPLMSIAEVLQARLYMGVEMSKGVARKTATQFLSETLQNMKTVKSFRAEKWALDLYSEYVHAGLDKLFSESVASGLAFGFSVGVGFAVYAVGFYFGGYLVAEHGLNVQDFTQGLMGVLMASAGAAQAVVFLPDINKAKLAAHDVFAVLDSKPSIVNDSADDSGNLVVSNRSLAVEFKEVKFSYPNRPGMEVLRGLSFSVQNGQRVALCGPSGGGKSTVMALLQRFYDPCDGSISFAGKSVKEWNLNELRSQIGYVIQEPVLFDLTLEENLKYGNPFVREPIVTKACIEANIDFVPSSIKLTDKVGAKGGLLSGGQKQRVAIARALIKEPKVLVLDEATSALDSANEKIVQAAIDKASEGITSFVIAHRLSTIENADLILVIAEGVLAESGTHKQLMDKKGVYYNLVLKSGQ